jgi:hypothetical protein
MSIKHWCIALSSPKNLAKILVPIYRTQGDSVKHLRQKSSFKQKNNAYKLDPNLPTFDHMNGSLFDEFTD